MRSINVLFGFVIINVKYISLCIKKKKFRKEYILFDI